jgi:HD-GYP domain-containing protein (c-di-GMP phosphodiesterase class II)
VGSILGIIRSLNQLKGVDMILERILLESRGLANADAGSLYLLKNDVLVFSHVQNDTLFGVKGAGAAQYANVRFPVNSDTIVGYAAHTMKAVSCDNVYAIPEGKPYKFNPSFDRENNYKTHSILAVPLLSSKNSLVGVIQLINARDEDGNPALFSENSTAMAFLFANSAAMTIEQGLLNRQTILRMVKMAALHDPKETGAHVQRVSTFSAELYQRWAEKRGVSPRKIRNQRDLISLAAMSHDAGKVGISDLILKKPARLTTVEFDIMKRHTMFGAQLFSNAVTELDKMTYDVALYHHEKWNGKGYPGKVTNINGDEMGMALRGEEIPLVARIVALADVFDALSSSRCYKDPWKQEDVYQLIRSESGEHFDPELVDVFFEIIDILCAIQERYQ